MGQSEHRTIGITVHGDVQGVGFRWYTRQVARDLGVSGTVANRHDGTVRIVARGTPEVLEDLQHSVRRGPPHASVSHLEVQELPETFVGGGFEIVHASS